MAKKFYAVVKGHAPGIYNSWEHGAKAQVTGFPAARFKGFYCESEARHWYQQQVDPDYQGLHEAEDENGFAIMVMLRPHGHSPTSSHIQMLGTGLYEEETEAMARKAALEEHWRPEHDQLGIPLIEIHGRPSIKAPLTPEAFRDKFTDDAFDL